MKPPKNKLHRLELREGVEEYYWYDWLHEEFLQYSEEEMSIKNLDDWYWYDWLNSRGYYEH